MYPLLGSPAAPITVLIMPYASYIRPEGSRDNSDHEQARCIGCNTGLA